MATSDQALIAAQEETPAGFLRLLGNRNYALLWSGELISEIGNRLHWVAISLWIFSVTQSAAAVSIAISSMFAGTLLVSLWAGAIVDLVDRKRILVFSNLVRAGLVASIPMLMTISLWLVYMDLVLISVATAFFRPALLSVLPQVVRRNDLLPANSFFSAMTTGTEIAGPALAGVIAIRIGYAPLLYLDAGTYLVSALCILAMSIPSLVEATKTKLNIHTVWVGVREGLNYIRRDSLQWGLFMLLFPIALTGASLTALQTPLAKGVVGISDSEFGTFQAIWGGGFVAASLILGWYGARLERNFIVLGGYFLAFIAMALMGLSTSFLALVATGFAVGIANTFYYVGLSTTLMEHTPKGVLGRVLSTRQLAIATVRVISPLTLGIAADVIGVRETILAMAAVGILVTVIMLGLLPVTRSFKPGPFEVDTTKRSLWFAFAGSVNPEFDESPQQRLNLTSILVAFLAWLGLALALPTFAFGLLALVPLFVLFGGFARKKGWLKAPGS